MDMENNYGTTVWEEAVNYKTFKSIPKHLITADLLIMKNTDSQPLLNKSNRKYVEGVISERSINFTKFIKNNPDLETEIALRDTRLDILKYTAKSMFFQFAEIEDEIKLNTEGVFINDVNYKTLNNAILFIEKKYPNTEQSIILPISDISKIADFVL